MRWGYGWTYGPFELIDQLGADWLAGRLRSAGRSLPDVLESISGSCYTQDAEGAHALSSKGTMVPLLARSGVERLADHKRGRAPLLRNASASLWDIGDRVLCLEFHSKMNALDQGTLEIAYAAIRIVSEGGFAGLVIFNDAENFSVGANVGIILFAANTAAWDLIEQGLKGGQDVLQALRSAPFPVVGAPAGMALGGGCEFLLHCDAVQAHAETYMGLVEVGVGLVPGWGGCAELLSRWHAFDKRPQGPIPPVQKTFEIISLAKVSRSAAEAQEMLFLLPRDRISMNRDRLLADARARVLELADDYSPPAPHPALFLPGPSGHTALQLAIHGFELSGHATPHDVVVANALARLLTGGEADITTPIEPSALRELEREAFLGLVRMQATAARLEHMLETGRPLRN
jgi:3-hydroxyacyl-CoA dehydrogenase